MDAVAPPAVEFEVLADIPAEPPETSELVLPPPPIAEPVVVGLGGAVAICTASALAASVCVPMVVMVPEAERTSVQTAVPAAIPQSSRAMPPETSGMAWMRCASVGPSMSVADAGES